MSGTSREKVATGTKKKAKRRQPLDYTQYEDIVDKYEDLKEPRKSLCLFPEDDIVLKEVERGDKNVDYYVDADVLATEGIKPHLKKIFELYRRDWISVKRNYEKYGEYYSPKKKEPFSDITYEIDDVEREKKREAGEATDNKARLEDVLNYGDNYQIGSLRGSLLEKKLELREDSERRRRAEDRMRTFQVSTQGGESIDSQFTSSMDQTMVVPYSEKRGTRILFTLKEYFLTFGNHEKITLLAALYDSVSKIKVSEDIYFYFKKGKAICDNYNKAIFTVPIVSQNIVLVVKVYKTLTGNEKAIDCYTKETIKDREKLIKRTEDMAGKFELFDQLLSWAAIPIFELNNSLKKVSQWEEFFKPKYAENSNEVIFTYANDQQAVKKKLVPVLSKMSFDLLDFQLLQENPDNSVDFSNQISHDFLLLDENGTVQKRYRPESRKNKGMEKKALRRVLPFKVPGQPEIPYINYQNDLFVYPLELQLDKFPLKLKSKLKNVAIKVWFKDNDKSLLDVGLNTIYSNRELSPLTTLYTLPVVPGIKSPTLSDEIKIRLPPLLSEKHHVLFTFHQLNVTEKPKKNEQKELLIGYSFFHITLENGAITTLDEDLPVIPVNEDSMPTEYTNVVREEIVRSYLKCNLELSSSVYTQDLNLQKFFVMFDPSMTLNGMTAGLQNLLKTPSKIMINHFPVIMNILIEVLCAYRLSPEVPEQIQAILGKFITQCVKEDPGVRNSLLMPYVDFVFRNISRKIKTVGPNSEGAERPHRCFHHIILAMKRFLLSDDYTYEGKSEAMKNSFGFLFSLVVKSLGLEALQHKLITSPRKNRYSKLLYSDLRELMVSISKHVVERGKRAQLIAKGLNRNGALFIKDLFALLDRGELMKIILDGFNALETVDRTAGGLVETVGEFRFEYLKILSNYEHFIPLNPLPPSTLESGSDIVERSKKFNPLIHLLIKEMVSVVFSQKDEGALKMKALTTLKELMTKHDFDDRYSSAKKKELIAALYLPLLVYVVEILRNGEFDLIEANLASKTNRKATMTTTALEISRKAAATTVSLDTSRKNSQGAAALDISRKAAATVTSPEQLRGPSNQATSPDAAEEGGDTTKSPEDAGTEVETVKSEKGVQERRTILLCVLFILGNSLPRVKRWWRVESKDTVVHFMELLRMCLDSFEYDGRSTIEEKMSSSSQRPGAENAKTMIESMFSQGNIARRRNKTIGEAIGSDRRSFKNRSLHTHTIRAKPVVFNYKLEAWQTNVVSMIVLDSVSGFQDDFSAERRSSLKAAKTKANKKIFLDIVFNLLVEFISTNQSERVLSHALASLLFFVEKNAHSVFIDKDTTYCKTLCKLCVNHLNFYSKKTRLAAATFLYSILRKNFEISKIARGNANFSRSKVQTIVGLSELVTQKEESGDIKEQFINDALTAITNYSTKKEKKMITELRVNFGKQTKVLMEKLTHILNNSLMLAEYKYDPEMTAELKYKIIEGYRHAPDLRYLFLRDLSDYHLKHDSIAEAALCWVHVSAMISEYLREMGRAADGLPDRCERFVHISKSAVTERAPLELSSDIAGFCDDEYFSPGNLIKSMREAITLFEQAGCYEIAVELHKLILPFYENGRKYANLYEGHKAIADMCLEIYKLNKANTRYVGTYYRVEFVGKDWGDMDGKQYVYKEPKMTHLFVFSERLKDQFSPKFGNVVILKDSTSRPEPGQCGLRVTSVTPYFNDEEISKRLTPFETEVQIDSFVFETPFTSSGKAHGTIEDQCIKKTTMILADEKEFPYILKRLPTSKTIEKTLEPIQVAIDAMTKQTQKLKTLADPRIADMRTLQGTLQGSVRLQVNEGPMGYCNAFLAGDKRLNHNAEDVEIMTSTFVDFLKACYHCMTMNKNFVFRPVDSKSQSDAARESSILFHKELEKGYVTLTNQMLEKIIQDDDEREELLTTLLEGIDIEEEEEEEEKDEEGAEDEDSDEGDDGDSESEENEELDEVASD